MMDIQEKTSVFLELIHCSHHMDYWIYSPEGILFRSTAEAEHVLDLLFKKTGCFEYMQRSIGTTPMILSGEADLHWIAIKQMREDKISAYHVLGPFLTSSIHESVVQYAHDAVHGLAPQTGIDSLAEDLQALSVVSIQGYCQYAVMLHNLVNGELLPESCIQHQPAPLSGFLSASSEIKVPKKMKDRLNIYLAERTLLHAIMEGDANAAAASSLSAQKQVARVRAYTGNALLDMKIACTTFTTLCTRAAIEGGLSPSFAYPIGDDYIRKIFASNNLEYVGELKTHMYNDFVARVHELRVNPNYSKPIQSCCDYIQLHPAEPLSIDVLANRLGYSKYYLSALFKKETGCSVSAYIKCARIERAKVLLSSTDLSVENIWEAVGFSSRSVFGKAFCSIVGMTPREYRERNLIL